MAQIFRGVNSNQLSPEPRSMARFSLNIKPSYWQFCWVYITCDPRMRSAARDRCLLDRLRVWARFQTDHTQRRYWPDRIDFAHTFDQTGKIHGQTIALKICQTIFHTKNEVLTGRNSPKCGRWPN